LVAETERDQLAAPEENAAAPDDLGAGLVGKP
jgi:hypothetical protein